MHRYNGTDATCTQTWTECVTRTLTKTLNSYDALKCLGHNMSASNSAQGSDVYRGTKSLIARFMGPTWAHLGPTGPRWATCWPHELCYLGYHGRDGKMEEKDSSIRYIFHYCAIIWCAQIIEYIMSRWSYLFVCTLQYLIIIIMQTYLKVLNL